MTDIKELRRLAELCTVGDPWYEESSFKNNPVVQIDIDAKFIAMCNPPSILSLLDHIEQQEAEIARLRKDAANYHELVYSVGNKHPGESRHETALRYIKSSEMNGGQGMADTSTQEVG